MRGNTVRDPLENMEYKVYCKTDLLKALCPQIIAVGLPDVDVILDDYSAQQHRQQQRP